MSARAIAGLALAAVVLGGCVAGPRPVVGFERLEELPPAGTVSADDVAPLQEVDWHFTIDGDAQRPVVITMRPTDLYRATWVMEEAGQRAEYLTSDDAGNVVMTAVAEYPDEALTVFRPPLTIAFATMSAGDTLEAKAEMAVLDLNDFSKKKESGTATRTITYAGDQRIQTPLGEFVARRIEIDFSADLGMADVRDTATLYIVEGEGLVAEVQRQEIRVLGLLPSTKGRTLVLVERP